MLYADRDGPSQLFVKLGTATGMDLAWMNHRYFRAGSSSTSMPSPKRASVRTDLGQVIGTAIALNMLILQIPLPAGCALSAAETLLILLFYNNRELRRIRV